jgi:hypothetical protein
MSILCSYILYGCYIYDTLLIHMVVVCTLLERLGSGRTDVQSIERSTAGTGSGIVEVKAMGLGTHVEYTSGTNELKKDHVSTLITR